MVPLVVNLVYVTLNNFILRDSKRDRCFITNRILVSLTTVYLTLFAATFVVVSRLAHNIGAFCGALFPVVNCTKSVVAVV